jgi:YVTN family beta-propeller protein
MTERCVLLSALLALCTVAPAQWVEAVVPTGQLPGPLCWQPAVNRVYVANEGDSTLTVIDGRTNEVLDPVVVGPAPNSLAANPGAGRLFVGCWGIREVVTVDCYGDTVVARHALRDRPYLLVSAPAFDRVLCIGESLLYVFSADGDSLRTTFGYRRVLTQPVYTAVLAPEHGKLYIFDGGQARVVDVVGDSMLPPIVLERCRFPEASCYHPGTGRVFVGSWSQVGFFVIDAALDSVLLGSTQVSDVHALVYNPTADRIYLASDQVGYEWVYQMNPATMVPTRLAPHPGCGEVGLCVNPVTNRGFAAYQDFDTFRVIVFDCEAGRELTRVPIPVVDYQRNCVNEAEGRVYFSGINQVVVIRDSLLTGVEEPREAQRRLVGRGPTIVRGILFQPVSPFTTHSSLFDHGGRKVMELRPGGNDVRHLSPGVYLVREAETDDRGAGASRKVVVLRGDGRAARR